jgi:hypothetical protein
MCEGGGDGEKRLRIRNFLEGQTHPRTKKNISLAFK